MMGHNWALTGENLSPGFANNKGPDQPVYPRRLISAFVISFLDGKHHISTCYKQNCNFLACLCSLGLSLALSETLKTGLVRTRPNYD